VSISWWFRTSSNGSGLCLSLSLCSGKACVTLHTLSPTQGDLSPYFTGLNMCFHGTPSHTIAISVGAVMPSMPRLSPLPALPAVTWISRCRAGAGG
jgi:hypothetical protein